MSVLTSLTASLHDARDLTAEEIAGACDVLIDEQAPLPERADFLRALHRKGETPAEMASFVQVMLTHAKRPSLGPGLLDVCGTGGDRAGLFNVSTAVMFVVAACGVRVVKHGNRGITSKSGGADVLEALGVRIDQEPERALKLAGCCFLFAPLYHPAFKAIGPVRKALAEEGTPTIFNKLGPLLNPAKPDFQLSGVFDEKLLPIYAEVFRLLGRRQAWAAHGTGGLDEVSTMGPSRVFSLEDGKVAEISVDPEELGLPLARHEDLLGGTSQENAVLIEELLTGRRRGPARDIVALNAACSLVVAGAADDLPSALKKASAAFDNGSALDVLNRLRF